tara:strand:+ start:22662 stop:24395 length:1734 start_codon:yes stop_codon:yes gene_type:complete
MAIGEQIVLSLVTDAVKAKKDIDKVSASTKEAKQETTLLSAAFGKVKAAMVGVKATAKVLFGSIKAGLISTGIGAFVVVIGSMVQFFKDSEEGASKLKGILAQVGVVVGNITDIVSNLGKAFFNLLTGDFNAFKDGIAEAIDGVKNFGEQTRTEMQSASQLEKDRLALQKFEREASVEKAKTESEIMRLRLQARDIEQFTNEERLSFMRQANKLADEQLEKDLHVAKEKLRFQQVENSYSKSTQENLDAEAALEAELHRITRSNFSERKRMKSEEQALVREQAAERKKIEADAKKKADDIKKQEEADAKAKAERMKKSNEMLQKLQNEELIAQANNQFEKARVQAGIEEEAALAAVEGMENQEALKTAIRDKYAGIRKGIAKAEADAEIALEKQKAKAVADTLGNAAALAGEGTEAFKALKLAETIINTATGAQAAYTATVGIPVVGPVLAPINAGLAIAAGMKQVDTIMQTQVPEAKARGGIIRGYGSGTSDSIPARLSRGEVVINAKSAKAFRPLLSSINVAGGGIGFARGGATAPDVGDALDMMSPTPVKAFVVTDDMTKSQDRLSKIRRRASL